VDTDSPFTITSLVELAQQMSEHSERWAMWRNLYGITWDGSVDTNVNEDMYKEATWQHFIGVRKHTGDADFTMEVFEDSWCRSSSDFSSYSMANLIHKIINARAAEGLQDTGNTSAAAVVPLREFPLTATAEESSTGTSVNFKWTRGKQKVPGVNLPAWPVLDKHKSLDIADLHSAALSQLPEKWQGYCKADVTSDIHLLKLSAHKGSLYAALQLAKKLHAGGKKAEADEWLNNKTNTVQKLTEMAEKGDADAAYNLGLLYFAGQGVAQDLLQAGELYLEAAAQKHVKATVSLGRLCTGKLGIPANLSRAAQLFSFAADNHGGAAYYLSEMHAQGKGVPQDNKTAIQLLKWSAYQHRYAHAQFQLAEHHRIGLHVEHSVEHARKLYGLAAAQQHPAALRSVGLLYWRGISVKKDLQEALFWMEKSVKVGDKMAAQAHAKLKTAEKYEKQRAPYATHGEETYSNPGAVNPQIFPSDDPEEDL